MAPTKLFGGVLVGIAISVGGAFAQSLDDPDLKYLPIELKCPSENNGMLERMAKNWHGSFQRIRIYYEQDTATFVSNEFSPKAGQHFISVVPRTTAAGPIDLRTITDPRLKEYAGRVAKLGDGLVRDVCLASAEKRKSYFAALKANAAELGMQ